MHGSSKPRSQEAYPSVADRLGLPAEISISLDENLAWFLTNSETCLILTVDLVPMVRLTLIWAPPPRSQYFLDTSDVI
jgi:hypothetical protein